MTEKLKKAVAQAELLSEEQQNVIATLILEEIEDEASWDAAFARSQDLLERLSEEAEAEDRQGLAEELDLDAL